MTPQEIDLLAGAIVGKCPTEPFFWLAWLVVVVVSGVSACFGSYLREKAKNAATKEDVKAITKKIESVKHEFAQQIEDLRGKHQLRMAALDKRLAAHQEAYALWRKLFFNVHRPRIDSVVSECQVWWENNCLYLSPEARQAFWDSFQAASMHRDFLDGGRDPENMRAIKENWRKLTCAGTAITVGVDLPPVGEREFAESMSPLNAQAEGTA